MTTVLGIHRDPWHDSGCAVVSKNSNGERVIFNIAEERLNREKDSRAYPVLSIEAAISDFGLSSVKDFDLIVKDYIISKEYREDFNKRESVSCPYQLENYHNKMYTINHHLCHAASAFYSSGFQESAILVVDGRGSDRETQSLYYYDGDNFNLIETTSKIGIGLLYATITKEIGFKLLQEGKTMGLAPYGKAVYERKGPIYDFGCKKNGIETSYEDFCVNDKYEIKVQKDKIKCQEDAVLAAYQVQLECENAMQHLVSYAAEVTGSKNLCISGGVALNSVSNYKLREKNDFTNYFIPPACSDTGIALGAALYGYHQIKKEPYMQNNISAYVGPGYSEADVYAVIKELKLDPGIRLIEGDKEYINELSVEILLEGKILGVCCGRSEMGPRALGNRSILMNATDKNAKSILNARVKHREEFRPFAPICLSERASEFFEIDYECEHMLYVPKVREDKKNLIPAVVHIDNTARVQTISRNSKIRTRSLLEKYEARSGIPVLINTSFNDNDEPIVQSPMDAYRCMKRTNLDALLFDSCILVKRKND